MLVREITLLGIQALMLLKQVLLQLGQTTILQA